MSTRVNPAVVAVVAEGFASRLSFGVISFALPLYAYRLGLSMAEIGLLSSINLAVSVAFKPLMGWVADSFGLKRSFCLSLGVRSVVALLLSFAAAPWQLFAIKATHGLSKALRDPSAHTLLAEHGSKKAIASAFAWYQTAKSLAGSLGKALAGMVLGLTASDFSMVFGVAFLLSAAPILLVLRLVPASPSSSPEAVDAGSEGAEAGLGRDGSPDLRPGEGAKSGVRPGMLSFAGLGFLIAATAQMLQGVFPILATEYAGLSEAETGVIFLVSGVAGLFAGPFFGWLSDNVSRRLTFMVRSVANIVSSLIYLARPDLAGIATGRIVDDVGKAAFRPAWGSLMTQVTSQERAKRARAMGLMGMGEDAGEIAGPILAGLLWHTWGVAATLSVRVVLAAITEVYALVLAHRTRSGEAVRQPERLSLSARWNSDEA